MAQVTSPYNLKLIYTNREKTKFKLQFENIEILDKAHFICTLMYDANPDYVGNLIAVYEDYHNYTSINGNVYESIEFSAYTLHTPNDKRFGYEITESYTIRFFVYCHWDRQWNSYAQSDIIKHDAHLVPPYPVPSCVHTPLYNEITDYNSYCDTDITYGNIIKEDKIALEDKENNIYSVSIVSKDNWNDFIDKIKYLRSLYIANDSYSFRYVTEGEYLSADIFNNIANALIGLNVYLVSNDFIDKKITFSNSTHEMVYVKNILPNALNVSVYSGRILNDVLDNLLLKLERYYIGTINIINLINRGETEFTDIKSKFNSYIYNGIIITDDMLSSKILS